MKRYLSVQGYSNGLENSRSDTQMMMLPAIHICICSIPFPTRFHIYKNYATFLNNLEQSNRQFVVLPLYNEYEAQDIPHLTIKQTKERNDIETKVEKGTLSSSGGDF